MWIGANAPFLPDDQEPESLPPESISTEMKINLIGIDEDLGTNAGNSMMHIIRELSRYWPLNNLDGVTVAFDYAEALGALDRGFPVITPAEATQDEIGTGVGMVLTVRRESEWKNHIVFGPSVVELLTSEDSIEVKSGMKLVAHELGHVADAELKRRAIGDTELSPIESLISDLKEQYLYGLSHHIWDEYFASRSASIFHPEGGSVEDELFCKTHAVFSERIREARVDYHWHRIELEDLMKVIKHNFYLLLLAAGYVFGLADGLEKELAEITPRSAILLGDEDMRQLREIHQVLLMLWQNRGEWNDFTEFLAINRPTEKLLEELEFFVSVTDEGWLHMEVPVRL